MIRFFAIAIVTLLWLVIYAEPTQAAQAESNTGGVRITRDEQRLVDAINRYRKKRNLAPLSVDPTLMRVARHAAPCFNHVVDGKWSWQRARQAGFSGHATDNLANGYPTPEDAVQGWATSDGHAHQMRGYFKMNGQWCNYHFNCVGVGVCGKKYVAVFGCDNSQRKRYETARPVEEPIKDHNDEK